jgi:hypothetical protein
MAVELSTNRNCGLAGHLPEHETLPAPSILQAPVNGSASHIAVKAEWAWLKSYLFASATVEGCVTPVDDFLLSQFPV